MPKEANTGYELICVIVNHGLGSRIMHTAMEHGVSGGTVFQGKGTAENRLLDFFALTDIRKEIVFMVSGCLTADNVIDVLNVRFKFDKPGNGIVFTVDVKDLIGSKNCARSLMADKKGAGDEMYEAIMAIVDKGKAENVIDAAVKAGSKGGTIINARGSGIHETMKLFSMDIEPEKEIVMILSEKGTTDAIVSSIRNDLKIDEPGKGIIFTLDVGKAYGLV